jgi:3-deoxy-D-manno-octulosonic-acid transferase
VRERAPLVLRLYRRLATVATPVLPLWWSYRLRHGKEERTRLCERRGETNAQRPDAPLIWFHSESVGEMMASVTMVEHV